MYLQIDENEQRHIYSCLLVGGQEFQKVKKSLAKLNREDDAIDEELTLNAKLRREFNPRAEEEARERARAKDPTQLDLEEAASSGETGGMRSTVRGPGVLDAIDLFDALWNGGFAVGLPDVEDWSIEQRGAVQEWLGQVVAAHTIGGTIPEMPEPMLDVTWSVERVHELLALGPYRVEEAVNDEQIGTGFEVGRDGMVDDVASFIVDDVYADERAAEIRAAALNVRVLQTADMSDEDVERFAALGPWEAVDADDGVGMTFFVRAGTQTEFCESMADALGRAARYNRSIAERREAMDAEDAAIDRASEALQSTLTELGALADQNAIGAGVERAD